MGDEGVFNASFCALVLRVEPFRALEGDAAVFLLEVGEEESAGVSVVVGIVLGEVRERVFL